MKLRPVLCAGLVVVAPLVGWAQQPSGLISSRNPPIPDLPVVRVGVFLMKADGRIGSFATESGEREGDDLTGTVYVAPCAIVGAANVGSTISSSATDVWQLSGRVFAMTTDQASVQVGWQRLRRAGKEEMSAPQTTPITLKRGERMTLDTLAIPAMGACAPLHASLDIVFSTMREVLEQGAAAGTSPGSGPPSVSARVTGRLLELVFDGSKGANELASMRADLWLVRSSPGRADDLRHTTSRFSPVPRTYAFDPLSIHTPAGTFTVTVEGTIEAGTSSAGEPQLHFSAKRTTTFAAANRAVRDAPPVVEVSTKTTVGLQKLDDVLSFELPPLQTPNGASVPDKLSVRVKLTPDGVKTWPAR